MASKATEVRRARPIPAAMVRLLVVLAAARPSDSWMMPLDPRAMKTSRCALAARLLALPLLTLPLLIPAAAVAQKRIPKLPGYDQCPLGYVNDLKQHCNSPIYYEVRPTYGKPCESGWMNIGAGYCKKKTLGIF